MLTSTPPAAIDRAALREPVLGPGHDRDPLRDAGERAAGGPAIAGAVWPAAPASAVVVAGCPDQEVS